MLCEFKLHKRFWGEAINTANYLQNRLPTKVTNKTPYELWFNTKPNLKHLRVFGCKAFAYIHKSKRGKLDYKAEGGIFIGYDNHAKAYRIYVEGKNVTLAGTAKFFEDSAQNSNYKSVEKTESAENETKLSNPETKHIEVA